MSKIISKVTKIPTTLTPNMIYLVKSDVGVTMSIANSTGSEIEPLTIVLSAADVGADVAGTAESLFNENYDFVSLINTTMGI